MEGIFSSTVLGGLIGCDDDVEGLESRSVTGANGDSIELRSIRIVGSTWARTSFSSKVKWSQILDFQISDLGWKDV